MSKFIELVDSGGRFHFVNVDYIEDVVKIGVNECEVYFAFNCPNACEQDYIKPQQTYDDVVAMIRKAVQK